MQGKITNYDPDTGKGQLEVERHVFDAIDAITEEMMKKNEAIKVRKPPTIGEGGGVLYWFTIAEKARRPTMSKGVTVEFDEGLKSYEAVNLR
ncbi:hypothetical protein [Pseudomonas triticicola]|uniref:hypothetical protein n=1 Tax=Pseudomonas triticicola TaxID=2842345 RepID=UPI003EB8AA72